MAANLVLWQWRNVAAGGAGKHHQWRQQRRCVSWRSGSSSGVAASAMASGGLQPSMCVINRIGSDVSTRSISNVAINAVWRQHQQQPLIIA